MRGVHFLNNDEVLKSAGSVSYFKCNNLKPASECQWFFFFAYLFLPVTA